MIRVLFCGGVLPAFFDATPEERKLVLAACKEVFGSWEERFDVRVLASLDDDQIQIGPSFNYPWTFYVIAEAPAYDAVVKIVNQFREGENPLYKYIKIETRIGRAATILGLS